MTVTEAESQITEEVTATPTAAAERDALFHKSEYDREDLALPKVDGEGVDKIAIKFRGTVFLDRSEPADVALMRAMKLGGDVTLQVEADCTAKAHKFTTSRDGELDTIVLEHGARVHTICRPVLEDEEPEA